MGIPDRHPGADLPGRAQLRRVLQEAAEGRRGPYFPYLDHRRIGCAARAVPGRALRSQGIPRRPQVGPRGERHPMIQWYPRAVARVRASVYTKLLLAFLVI